MISEHYLESDGERLLLRLVISSVAALDVLTDRATLNGAVAMLQAPEVSYLGEHRLGSFGPFDVVLSFIAGDYVAMSVDGPDLGKAFRGDQSMVIYVARDELLEILAED